jgi:GTP-binding protein
MKITNSEFIKSSPDHKDCPQVNLPEFAFIGRSNVGKSSLINMVLDRKNLAMVSARPGKTQLINHFLINHSWHLVDLPGYGWAKVSKEKKSAWDKMIRNYLQLRKNLACVFVLVDSRHEPKTKDIEFINWLGKSGIPFVILFTKADKQSMNKTEANIAAFKKILKLTWEEIPEIIITSAIDKQGRKEVLDFIGKVLTDLKN